MGPLQGNTNELTGFMSKITLKIYCYGSSHPPGPHCSVQTEKLPCELPFRIEEHELYTLFKKLVRRLIVAKS